MKHPLLLLLSSICFTFLFAQAPTRTVRGQPIDAETQQPLAGANVQLLALGQGAAPDVKYCAGSSTLARRRNNWCGTG